MGLTPYINGARVKVKIKKIKIKGGDFYAVMQGM
jgi:hypothetical protein